jgi:arylsulfatase A-like enzyme
METRINKKPHIIIFNPDQMRSDVLGHLGNPSSQTPFLDRMVTEDAVSFGAAFCQNPVCVPSRCSFLTGLYPHVAGHRTMHHLMRSHETSLLKELKESGYYVWMNTRNDFAAGQIPGFFESHATEVYYGGKRKQSPGPENSNPRGKPGDKNYYSFYTGRLKTDEDGRNYSPDDEDVDAAIERIKNPVDEKPLCIFLGLGYPHPPYMVEDPWFSSAKNIESWRRAKVLDNANKPLMESLIRKYQQLDAYTEEDWNALRSCYLGMCAKVDDQFRRLCQGLKEAEIYDDSLIFFFSDHGDYTGDYNIVEKAQNCFEDALVKVPLIVKPLKKSDVSPGISGSLVELVDFYATVMDYAGVKPSHSHFGISLRPVLRDRNAKIRDYAFCEGGRLEDEEQADEYHGLLIGGKEIGEDEEYYPRLKAHLDGKAHGKAVMIRSEHYKYIRRLYEGDDFYDLLQDPLEERNAVADPQYRETILSMQRSLLDWYQRTCDIVPLDYDNRFSSEALWNKVKDFIPPEYAEKAKKIIEEGNVFEMKTFFESLAEQTGGNKEAK